jgi:hypothetical protein
VERIVFVGLEMSESVLRIAQTQNGKEARIHSDGYSAADGLSECARANGAVAVKSEGRSKDWTGNLGRRSQQVETAIPQDATRRNGERQEAERQGAIIGGAPAE